MGRVLKAEFNGRNFSPTSACNLPGSGAGLGNRKTLAFAEDFRKTRLGRRILRALASLATGEHGVYLGANLTGTKSFMSKDVAGVLSYKMVEPIPIRIGDAEAVFQKADSPYAALLWLEFVANPEAQKIIEAGYKGSVFSPGTTAFQVARTKKISLVDWRHYTKMQEYMRLVVEAYGFPKAETVGK
jgi:hypothetical protein